MGLNTWNDLLKVKTSLVALTDATLQDDDLSKEQIAFDLMMIISDLNEVEAKHAQEVLRKDMKHIGGLAEAAELKVKNNT